MHYIAQYGNIVMAHYLIDNPLGFDNPIVCLEAENKRHQTPCDFADACGNWEVR
jgi:hypothetical protein